MHGVDETEVGPGVARVLSGRGSTAAPSGATAAPRRGRAAPEPEPEPVVVPTTGKGRATPRRRDVENARRTRARVPQGRKEASIARRARMREARENQAEAMRTGDEKGMPPRDKGPVKRFVRDTVDSKRHVAEYFLPIVLLVTFGSVPLAARGLSVLPNFLLLGVLAIVVADSLMTTRRLRREITTRFGAENVKGNLLYGVLRSTQFRRIRQPKPQVGPGTKV